VRAWDGAALREVRELVAGAAGNPADGAAVLALSRSASLAITDHEPDQEGRDLAVTDARGARTAFVRDERGRLVGSVDALGAASSLTLDADGRVTADLPPAIAGEPAAVRSVSYDARGLVAAATDRRGNASSFAYTLDGSQASVTDPLGNVASTIWHRCCARPLLTLDADGDGVVAHYLPTGEPVLQAAVRSASGLFASSRGTATSVTASISLPADRTLSATTTSYDSRGPTPPRPHRASSPPPTTSIRPSPTHGSRPWFPPPPPRAPSSSRAWAPPSSSPAPTASARPPSLTASAVRSPRHSSPRTVRCPRYASPWSTPTRASCAPA